MSPPESKILAIDIQYPKMDHLKYWNIDRSIKNGIKVLAVTPRGVTPNLNLC